MLIIKLTEVPRASLCASEDPHEVYINIDHVMTFQLDEMKQCTKLSFSRAETFPIFVQELPAEIMAMIVYLKSGGVV
jgi:hypothetical protein